ncbi:MAG: cystathionine beta-synthase, partial [Bdellovibrionales bacterium]|nr:hypothetical protein [Bdellovibrionales bacterium]NQZ18012.1 cystathionine beta-synthase [Bdellovibrionales bacterium]
MAHYKETLKQTISHLPSDWLRLTTHRLDIYNEKLAKVEFLEKFENLSDKNESNLSELPTAFDYIRLGHPLSCVLEWALAKDLELNPNSVISFSSQAMPILAILRKNKFLNKKTRLVTRGDLPSYFNPEILKKVYSYDLEVLKVEQLSNLPAFDGSTIVVNGGCDSKADFVVNIYPGLGSVILVMDNDADYIKQIQHLRRRESIAMTPHNSLSVLKSLVGESLPKISQVDKTSLEKIIQAITQTSAPVALGSCGLSVQYSIMMGLIHQANENHEGKDIQFIVPPNCDGGTNDHARRVAAWVDNVAIVDFPVARGNDMV